MNLLGATELAAIGGLFYDLRSVISSLLTIKHVIMRHIAQQSECVAVGVGRRVRIDNQRTEAASTNGGRRRQPIASTTVAAGSRRLPLRAAACVYWILPHVSLLGVVGCQMPWKTAEEFDGEDYARKPAAIAPTEIDAAVVQAVADQQPVTEEQALAGVLDKLQEIGAVDPGAQRKLMDDLKHTKPEHYPLIVEQFRTTLEYKAQLAARDSATLDPLASTKAQPMARAVLRDDVVRKDVVRSDAARTDAVLVSDRQIVEADDHQSIEAASLDAAPNSFALASADAAVVKSLPPPPARPGTEVERTDAQLQSASYASADGAGSGDASDWRTNLEAAIDGLRRSAAPLPRTTDELNEHFRLRALQLLAGHQEAAMEPVPGANPAQQDYWAKQLYAVSAYLDDRTHGDAKQRAAAALVHLDEARGRLSELATLQIRNLAFVESVDGFGEYNVCEATKFNPGDQVTLYAEVENFRSDSTAEGHRTRLGTSYQVLDKSGARVDGGQFPDVEDLCKSRRRDFHMQYGIALPTRIYAGEYQLQLIVTDGQSNKIAQSSVPFAINE